MKPSRIMAALLLSLLVATAAPSFAGKISRDTLVGTWQFDLLAVMEEQMKSMGQEVTPEMKAMFADAEMRIHFDASGTYTFTSKMPMSEETESGKWEITKIEADTLTLSTVDEKEKVEEVTITFTDSDHFTASMDQQGQKVELKAARVKAGKSGE